MLFIITCGIMLAGAGGYPSQINSFVTVCVYILSHDLASGPIPRKVSGEYDTARYWLVSLIPDAGIVGALKSNIRQKIDTDTDIAIIGKTETDIDLQKIEIDIHLNNRHRPPALVQVQVRSREDVTVIPYSSLSLVLY